MTVINPLIQESNQQPPFVQWLEILHPLEEALLCHSSIITSHLTFYFLPNDEILDWSKFKAFAYNKEMFIKKWKFGFRIVKNIVGKEENAGNQHFLFFPQCFQKLSFPEVLKVGIVWGQSFPYCWPHKELYPHKQSLLTLYFICQF